MNCKTPPHFDHCKSSNKFTDTEDSVDVDMDIEENVVGGCFGWNGFYLYEVREVIIYN